MQSVKAPRKITRRAELREDAVVTASSKAFGFFEENRQMVIYIALAIALALAALFAWQYFGSKNQAEASEHLGRIVSSWEGGQYQEALDGRDEKLGLLEIVDQYGSTEDGNLAKFYAADAHYNLGQYDEALAMFASYSKGANYLGVSALAGEASIYEDQGKHEEAADNFEDAALKFENAATSPDYLMSAARNYEKAGNYSKAIAMFDLLTEKYPEDTNAANADFHVARINSAQSN